MAWDPKTKPTPANIRRRISSTQEAIDAAMDLVKAHPTFGQKQLLPLNNAFAWLVEAQRRAGAK